MTPDLALALDVPRWEKAREILERLPPELRWIKIGLELFVRDGERATELVRGSARRLFLDLKFHDIPRTVAAAVQSAVRLGAELLTVHAQGGREMIRAAVEAANASGEARSPRIVAVTALTSLAEGDLRELGVTPPLTAWSLRLAEVAVGAGAHGLVCSVHEARLLRERFGPDLWIVTPGIRPAGAETGDQKRIATPAAAVAAGADLLVVGRPILSSPDPAQAVRAILEEMRAAQPG